MHSNEAINGIHTFVASCFAAVKATRAALDSSSWLGRTGLGWPNLQAVEASTADTVRGWVDMLKMLTMANCCSSRGTSSSSLATTLLLLLS